MFAMVKDLSRALSAIWAILVHAALAVSTATVAAAESAGRAIASTASSAAVATAHFVSETAVPAVIHGAETTAVVTREEVIPAMRAGADSALEFTQRQAIPALQKGTESLVAFADQQVRALVGGHGSEAGVLPLGVASYLETTEGRFFLAASLIASYTLVARWLMAGSSPRAALAGGAALSFLGESGGSGSSTVTGPRAPSSSPSSSTSSNVLPAGTLAGELLAPDRWP